jgi:SAM-dependent methyltransferase
MGVVDPGHYLHHRILRSALDGMPELAPRRILDAGCGPGDHTFYLAMRYPQAHVLGVDVDPRRVTACREAASRLALGNVRFEVADLAEPSEAFAGDPFDLIVSIDVLEHIVEQERALETLYSLMAPGAVAVLHIPTVRVRPVPFSNRLGAFHEWAEEEHVAPPRSADEFTEIVAATGFAVEHSRRTFGYWTGELATSLFALPFRSTARNRMLQALLAPVCRVLVLLDSLALERTRYAVAVVARRTATDPASLGPSAAAARQQRTQRRVNA